MFFENLTTYLGGQKEIWTSDDVWCKIKTYGGGVLVGAGAVALVPPAAGIVARAFAAAANGGGVVPGGVIAIIGVTSSGIYSYLFGGCSEDDIACKKKEK